MAPSKGGIRHGVHNEGLIESFARTTDDMVSLAEFRALLAEQRPLRIKFGADVTASFLHLGHAVNLWMMREMQERGHQVQFLIGDFTTRIGDPTGRDAARAERSRADIDRDAQEFIRQVGKILITDNPERFVVRRNADWWDGKRLDDFICLLGAVTSSRLLARDMVRARLDAGNDVRMHELIYPVLQGWDSVELESDLTIVGSDQLFNESMGRFFQERQGQRPQVIITTKITPGLDGVRKQSKSLNNFIALDDIPRQVFGKVMSLPDSLIPQWLEVYTTLPLPQIAEICQALASAAMNPMAAKRLLAVEIVARLHGRPAALSEDAWFMTTFSVRSFPVDAPELRVPAGEWPLLDLLALTDPSLSRSAWRRLIQDGAIELDDQCLAAIEVPVQIQPGQVYELRSGRRRFFRVHGLATVLPGT